MSRKIKNGGGRGRLYFVMAIMALCNFGLLARAVDLQLLNNDFLKNQGEARHLRDVEIPISRGRIVDRNGEPLAISTPVSSIWAEPSVVLEDRNNIGQLAKLLGFKKSWLEKRLSEKAEREFVFLKRLVAPELAASVLALDIEGIHQKTEFRRYYPAGDVAAHLVGFTNIDDRGQEGLELAYESWLQSKPGIKRVIKDRRGRIVEDVEMVKGAEPGRTLVLSVDLRVQYLAFRELENTVREFGAASGSIVVLDVGTGEVLAMVNQPSFNPNQRDKKNDGAMRNRAVTDVFEPGSVIKPITVSAGLESGLFTPFTTIDTAPGTYKVSGHTIRDIRNYGVLDVTSVVAKSSNVGVTKIAMSMESNHLWDAFSRFGFGSVTGSGFPGESQGILPHYERWREVEKATLAYGYRLSVTPLQLARAYSVLANGGRIRAPTFVRDAINPDQAVIDPTLAAQVLDMLERVVRPGGTGSRAQIDHYRVGGKTGTSRKVGREGYNDRYVAGFTGIAPLSNPKLVVVVMINDPSGDEYYGGQVAAPLFQRVMSGSLRLLNIPPDDAEIRLARAEPAS